MNRSIRRIASVIAAAVCGAAFGQTPPTPTTQSFGPGQSDTKEIVSHINQPHLVPATDANLAQLRVPAGFRVSASDGLAAEVQASSESSGKRPGESPPGAPLLWLTQVARVRPSVGRLAELLLYRAGTGAGAAPAPAAVP